MNKFILNIDSKVSGESKVLQSCAQGICKFMRQKTFSAPPSYNTGIKISYQILKQKSPDGHLGYHHR